MGNAKKIGKNSEYYETSSETDKPPILKAKKKGRGATACVDPRKRKKGNESNKIER